MWPLKLFRLCPKTAAMQAIVNDVLQERAHFTSCDSTCSMFLPLLISHHFNSQYVSNCLHIIPSHLRPSYNTCSTHSCCSALLHHIHWDICFGCACNVCVRCVVCSHSFSQFVGGGMLIIRKNRQKDAEEF